MDRHIDLDSAMINHLEGLGYKITAPDQIEPTTRHDVPDLVMLAINRSEQAAGKYDDAWDCLSNSALAEIIMMKANRAQAGVDNDDLEVIVDSLIDIINYGVKLYANLQEGD